MGAHSREGGNQAAVASEQRVLRELFEMTVRRCINDGRVCREGFAVNASLIRADVNKQRSAEGSEAVGWDDLARTRRSVREESGYA